MIKQAESRALVIGAGLHAFDKEMLPRYRQAVADIKRGSALEKAIATTLAADSNYKLGGQHYKTVPRGYDKEHPRAELLKHNGLHIMLECAYPTQAKSADFVPWVAEHMRQMLPMHRWIVGLIEDTAAK